MENLIEVFEKPETKLWELYDYLSHRVENQGKDNVEYYEAVKNKLGNREVMAQLHENRGKYLVLNELLEIIREKALPF